MSELLMAIKIWTMVKPIRLLRNRRRAKRGLPPLTDEETAMPEKGVTTLADGTQIDRVGPTIPLRSSTKAGAVGLASLPVLQLLQVIAGMTPAAWDDQLVMNAAFAQIVTLVVMYLTQRYTKSPITDQAL